MIQEVVQQTKNLVGDMINQVHTALPGTIASFDASSCTAAVLPSGKFKKPDGKYMDLPQISGVPVVLIQSYDQTATVAYPIKEGDGCLLLFAEQSLDSWMYGAESQTELRHDLTNAIAIVGLFVSGNDVVREACEQNAIIIDKDGKRITVSESGIAIRGDVSIEGNLTLTGEVTAAGDVTGGAISLQNHTHDGVSTGGDSTGRPQ